MVWKWFRRQWVVLLLPITFFLCIVIGSVQIPLGDVLLTLWGRLSALLHIQMDGSGVSSPIETILLSVRIPRVLNAALVGACLALSGAAMQGMLQNPLADGSTMGVSSGAALGALVALVMGWGIPWLPMGGMMGMSILFAMGSMLLVLWVARRMDYAMSNTTMVLLGMVFSMFASAMISMITAFSGEKLRSVTFWLMGSLSSGTYASAGWLAGALLVGAAFTLGHWHALDILSMGEHQAQHLGIDVRQVKIRVIVGVSIMIGICVSVGGSIAFTGLIVPHFVRLLTGPSHRKLLPYATCGGSIFLMLADLLARTLIAPQELPVGVITSFVGALTFGILFYRKGRAIR